MLNSREIARLLLFIEVYSQNTQDVQNQTLQKQTFVCAKHLIVRDDSYRANNRRCRAKVPYRDIALLYDIADRRCLEPSGYHFHDNHDDHNDNDDHHDHRDDDHHHHHHDDHDHDDNDDDDHHHHEDGHTTTTTTTITTTTTTTMTTTTTPPHHDDLGDHDHHNDDDHSSWWGLVKATRR